MEDSVDFAANNVGRYLDVMISTSVCAVVWTEEVQVLVRDAFMLVLVV